MKFCRLFLAITLLFINPAYSQQSIFNRIPFDSIGVNPYELYTTIEGVTWISSSAGLWRLKGREMAGPTVSDGRMYDDKGKLVKQVIKTRDYLAEDSIRSMAQGPDSIFYFVTHDNLFLWRPNGEVNGWGLPPFNFKRTWSKITKIWIDKDGNIYAGTNGEFYIIEKAGTKYRSWTDIDFGPDKDSNYYVTKGAKKITSIIISPNVSVKCFAADVEDKNKVWIGTTNGLYVYMAKEKKIRKIMTSDNSQTVITELYAVDKNKIWFSTLERGMGQYETISNTFKFYPYKKKGVTPDNKYPIKAFCFKTPTQFFVAVADSSPAIFDKDKGTYTFIEDSILAESRNQTTDIKIDKQGNLLLLKGGSLFFADVSKNEILKTTVQKDSSLLAPFIRSITLPNGVSLAHLDFHSELLKRIVLRHNQNNLIIYYDVRDLSDQDKIQFAWKIDGFTKGWIEMPRLNFDSARFAFLQDVPPGKYKLQVKVKIGAEDWRRQVGELEIIIKPPFWQTWWFWSVMVLSLTAIVYLIVWTRVKAVRKQERIKAEHEKQLLQLEAKALRAQMNPHFIFNCLNSIKSLIQDDEKDKSVAYLTTFSKLIRTLFNNADKKEISLYDEIETCKLYLQLEAMRFDSKFSYEVTVDESIDLKSVHVPALIIQPFIENAIWHGIIPKDSDGNVSLTVNKNNNNIEIAIEDNGIGREASKQNKAVSNIGHQSKGVNLTQSRLELDNLLQQRQAVLETFDKKNAEGKATGTKVIISLKAEI